MKTEDMLSEREKTHGDFEKVSVLWVNLVNDIRYDVREEVDDLGCTKIAAIEMILLKIARIVHGDPNHADHWDDIAGYAMLGRGKEKIFTIRQEDMPSTATQAENSTSSKTEHVVDEPDIPKTETTDGEWYDAEKCLPALNKTVTIEYEDDEGEIRRMDDIKFMGDGYNYAWHLQYTDEKFYPFEWDECEILKWKYAD